MASKATKPSTTKKAATAPVRTSKKTARATTTAETSRQGRTTSGRFAAYVPNDKDRTLVALGAISGGTQEKIAKVIGIDRDTLRKYYADEWDNGKDVADLKVTGNLYRMATMTGNDKVALTAAIWYSKSRMGWKGEGSSASGEFENPDGGVVRFTLKIGERGDDA